MGTIFFLLIFSLKPLLVLEGDQYLKESYFCFLKPFFFFIASGTDPNGSSLLVHLNRFFQPILHSG